MKFLLQMSQGAQALESNIQTVARAMKTGTAVTEEMAQAMNMDIGSQFKLLWQQIANLSEILGRKLLPVVTPIIQGISKAVEQGCAPFAPHLLYTRFLDDERHSEREAGIACGMTFMEACDEVWVFIDAGISDGMRREIDHARCLGKPLVEIGEL